MGKISSYNVDSNVTLSDKLIGSDAENTNATKNYLLSDIYDLFASQGESSSIGSPFFVPDIVYFGGTSCAEIYLENGYNTYQQGFSAISAPNLTTVKGGIVISLDNNNVVQNIDLSALETIGVYAQSVVPSWNGWGIYFRNLSLISTLNLSNLTTVKSGVYIDSCDILTNLNINNLQEVSGNFFINTNPLLTTLDVSSLTIFDNDFYVIDGALNQTSIDGILYQLAVVINLQNRTVNLSGGTNSAPSVTGDGYVATLISNGCTVITN